MLIMRKESIEQGQNDEVEQIEMKIVKLTRIGSNPGVVLHGDNNKQIMATLRSIKGFEGKRDFRPTELNNFLDGRINSITPIQPFIVYPIINKSTGLCYLITFERLIPTTPEFIDAQVYGRPYAIPSVIRFGLGTYKTVSYTHLRAHETRHDLVCRLLLEKKKKNNQK